MGLSEIMCKMHSALAPVLGNPSVQSQWHQDLHYLMFYCYYFSLPPGPGRSLLKSGTRSFLGPYHKHICVELIKILGQSPSSQVSDPQPTYKRNREVENPGHEEGGFTEEPSTRNGGGAIGEDFCDKTRIQGSRGPLKCLTRQRLRPLSSG